MENKYLEKIASWDEEQLEKAAFAQAIKSGLSAVGRLFSRAPKARRVELRPRTSTPQPTPNVPRTTRTIEGTASEVHALPHSSAPALPPPAATTTAPKRGTRGGKAPSESQGTINVQPTAEQSVAAKNVTNRETYERKKVNQQVHSGELEQVGADYVGKTRVRTKEQQAAPAPVQQQAAAPAHNAPATPGTGHAGTQPTAPAAAPQQSFSDKMKGHLDSAKAEWNKLDESTRTKIKYGAGGLAAGVVAAKAVSSNRQSTPTTPYY